MSWEQIQKVSPNEDGFLSLVQDFIQSNSNWKNILKEQIHFGDHWKAVVILQLLNEDQQKQLLEELIWLACGKWTTKEHYIFRKIILNMEKTWSNDNLMEAISKLLTNAHEDDNFAWAIELLIGLEEFSLADEIIRQALNDSEIEINDVARRYQEIVSNPKSEKILKFIQYLKT